MTDILLLRLHQTACVALNVSTQAGQAEYQNQATMTDQGARGTAAGEAGDTV